MAIPLKYNVRNLLVRKMTTLATAGGIALVVLVMILLLSLVTGLIVWRSKSRRNPSSGNARASRTIGMSTSRPGEAVDRPPPAARGSLFRDPLP